MAGYTTGKIGSTTAPDVLARTAAERWSKRAPTPATHSFISHSRPAHPGATGKAAHVA